MPQPGQPSPDALLQRASQAMRAGDFGTAERACRAVLQAQPNHPAATHILGGIALKAGHAEAGIDLLRRTVAVAPGYGEAWGSLGQALVDTDDIGGAEEAFQNALKVKPEYWPAISGLAAIWKGSGKIDQAQSALEKAVETFPQRPGPPFELANLLQEQDEYADAVQAYSKALKRNPNFAAALSNRAAARLKAGDPEGALEDADAYLATGAKSANVVAYRVLALQFQGRWDEARQWDDIQTMVYPATPDAEPGFNEKLVADIKAHPRLTGEWDNKQRAIRQGKMVLDLARDPTPAIAKFLAMIRSTVDELRDSLPDQADHPFLGAKPAKYEMSVWANILSTGGQQAPHIHNFGWLSGTYYPTLPGSINDDSDAGWISFGTPGYGLPSPDGLETRSLKPMPGSMFMFPSYLWHHTIPLETGEERISIAFDIVPV